MRIADDFGLGRGHDRVILSLLEARRLDGTSVMIDGAMKPHDIVRLRALRDAGAQLGLHLNLTQAVSGREPVWPLATLIRPTLSGRLLDTIAVSLARQTEKFTELFGSPPDYFDGHQHCHCLPALVPLVVSLPFGPRAWVRVPLPATWRGRWHNLRAGGTKTLAIMALAARARLKFTGAGLQVNDDFSGFLRLDDPVKVRLWLPRLLSAAETDCIMMLHPGDATDAMQCVGHAPESRAAEAQILIESAVK